MRVEAEVILSVEGLTKSYGELTAVRGLSLAVRRGEVLGFLGPNGAGKTTSISMMCGLLRPTAGTVTIHGRAMTATSADRLRVGLCPQAIVVWERLTCLEQLVFMGEMYGIGAAAARSRGESLLDALGLREKTYTVAGKLSGGMQRRLNVALALVHDPDVVVFDEPEAGLDPQSRVLVREFIQEQAARRAVILTTHNMDEADRVADRVAIIDRGEVLRVGTPHALKQDIGHGAILEVRFADGAPEAGLADRIVERLATQGDTGRVAHGRLVVEGHGMAERVAPVLGALRELAVAVESVVVREPTLEDVFLELTGRSLRE